MSSLSDVIENHLLDLLRGKQDGIIEIQRGELAERFSCVPSQINYVLETRFTSERGFLVESRRGGGGFIRIIRLKFDPNDGLHELIHGTIGDCLAQEAALGYVRRLSEHGLLTPREAAIIRAALNRDVLTIDVSSRDRIRASILKAMLLAMLRN